MYRRAIGIGPAILVLISHWFPALERARAYGFWMMNIALASIVTAPLSGWSLIWATGAICSTSRALYRTDMRF
jgi:MFS family permease